MTFAPVFIRAMRWNPLVGSVFVGGNVDRIESSRTVSAETQSPWWL
jgi:hypothetical protein